MLLSRLSPLGLVFGLGLFAVGCVEKPDDTGGDDSSTDDSSADDSSADDSSADDSGDPGEMSFTGTATVTSVLDGATVCNYSVDLASNEDIVYSGACADCDYGFNIDATITADSSTADCPYYYQFSWLTSGYVTDTFMGHFPVYYGYYGNYYDVFATGYGIDYYYYYYPGPYWTFWTYYQGSTAGTFTNTDGSLNWTWDYVGYDDSANYYYYCSYISDYAGTEVSGNEVGADDIACDGSVVDVWTFDGDGGEVSIMVDTVSDATAFDIYMWVNDGDECTIAGEDDTVDCTYPPPQYQCPSVTFTSAAETYQVVVASYDNCAGSIGEYTLKIDMDSDSGATLAYDDMSPTTAVPFEIHATGSGTITE